jgi:hypothetical protein
MLSLLSVLACIWVDQTEYNDVRDGLLDGDADGFQNLDHGGTDCDDADAAVYPGATETWYDGVDSDCEGDDDYDRDGDGSSAQAYGGDDCDDGDQAIGPQATETWYDGVDQDCDGGNDYDADGDGYTSADYEGDDCDDTSAIAYPGAAEVWYDDVDGDCLGGDDHDADLDGYPQGDLPGDDCDDADPDRNPTTLEVLGDKIDGDCDGGTDSFGFPHAPLFEITGVQGPIVKVSETEISVGHAAEEIVDPSDGYTVYDALSVTVFGPNTFEDGPLLDYPYGFESSSGEMGESYDFWSDGDHYVWASSLYKTGISRRFLYLDAIDFTAPNNNNTASYTVADGLVDYPYTGMDLFVDEVTGDITVVGCEGDSGSLAILQDTVDDFVPAGSPSLEILSNEPYPLCVIASGFPGSPTIWVTEPGVVGAGVGGVEDEAWINHGSLDLATLPIADWTLVDWEVEVFHDVIWTLIVDLAEGIYLWDGTQVDWIQPMGSGVLQADMAADGAGNVYVCGVSEAGKLRFWYGPLGDITEIVLETGLSNVEQCSVGANVAGLAIVAVRGDDRLIVGGVKNPAE